VFADAVAKRDPRTRLLYFDVTALEAAATPDTAQRWAAMIRQVGTSRIVFGSDATTPNVTPGDAWVVLRRLLPLTDDEFRAIAANLAPYLQ
jgi:predicted TIM-barrel fold metal-dependent hydrolase